MVTPTDHGPSAPAHHSPVGIHHLLQLIVEDKLGVPAEKQPCSVLPWNGSLWEADPGV